MKKSNQYSIEKLRAALEEIKKLRSELSDIGAANGDAVGFSDHLSEHPPTCFEIVFVGVESNRLLLRSVKDRNIMFSVICNDSSKFTAGELIWLDGLPLGSFKGFSNVYKYTKASQFNGTMTTEVLLRACIVT